MIVSWLEVKVTGSFKGNLTLSLPMEREVKIEVVDGKTVRRWLFNPVTVHRAKIKGVTTILPYTPASMLEFRLFELPPFIPKPPADEGTLGWYNFFVDCSRGEVEVEEEEHKVKLDLPLPPTPAYNGDKRAPRFPCRR